ncbi:hypothetical protein GCM10028858_04190 [Halorubrum pallidum]
MWEPVRHDRLRSVALGIAAVIAAVIAAASDEGAAGLPLTLLTASVSLLFLALAARL